MSKMLSKEARLAHLAAREDELRRKLKRLQQEIKQENFRLQGAVKRLAGAAYLAALDAGSTAPTGAEIFAHAREIAGPRDQDALALLQERLAPVDTNAAQPPEPAGERSDPCPDQRPPSVSGPHEGSSPQREEPTRKITPLPRPLPPPPLRHQRHGENHGSQDRPDRLPEVSDPEDDS